MAKIIKIDEKKNSLLLIERIVIESISKGNVELNTISKDTSLDIGLLKKIMSGLCHEKILEQSEAKFILNREYLNLFCQKECLQGEVREVFISWVNRYFFEDKKESCLKMQKLSLTQSEEVLYDEHLRRLSEFVEDVKKTSLKEKRKAQTSNQKVIFWGYSQYSNLVEASLHAL